MTRKKITDQRIKDIYHAFYIGKSQTADYCAQKAGYAGAQSFITRCEKLNLRLRTGAETRGATKGQTWTWPDEDPQPNVGAGLVPAQEQPDQDESAQETEKSLVPTGEQTEIINSTGGKFERSSNLLDTRLHNPTLNDLASLARDIHLLDSDRVQLRINLNLDIQE